MNFHAWAAKLQSIDWMIHRHDEGSISTVASKAASIARRDVTSCAGRKPLVPNSTPLPTALAALFVDKATISLTELAAKLPMDRKTLDRHIRAGRLNSLIIGTGGVRQHRAFREADVARFLDMLAEPHTAAPPGPLLMKSPSTINLLPRRIGTMNIALRRPR